MAELKENYDYAAINRRVNKNYDPFQFTDLRGIPSITASYDAKASPTDNIQKLLQDNVYAGDTDGATHHSYDVFHAIHEQMQAKGKTNGFNDLAETLRVNCTQMVIENGRIKFLDNTGGILGEFDAASSMRTDLRDRHVEQQEAVRIVTQKSLAEVLPEFQHSSLPVPNYHRNDFRLPPSYFRNTGEAPVLIDERPDKTAICAAYATEALRYYFGSRTIIGWQIEGLDAWELKKQLLKVGAAEVDSKASMNKFLTTRTGRPTLSFTVTAPNRRSFRVQGNKAKETPYYGVIFRNFYRNASQEQYPPGLITLYYHGTTHNADVVKANKDYGARSLNSHVVVNVGEGKKFLNLGVFKGPDKPKPVTEILSANFPKVNKNFDWAFLDGKADSREKKSRVWLNGEQLTYKKGTFFKKDGQEAQIYQNDQLEWEDIFVMDRFEGKNRVIGLTELMMTGQYELVDSIRIKPEAIPEEKRQFLSAPPYPVAEIFYLKPGENLTTVLLAKGVTRETLPYYLYAYERAGINAQFIRPFDPIPFFELTPIVTEVQNSGGLTKALAKVRTEHAADYEKKHPDQHLFIIQPGQSPEQLASKILDLKMLRSLGEITPKERQFILTAIAAANKNFGVEIDDHGHISSAYRFEAGEVISVPDDLQESILIHITEEREANAVYIPESLPGGEFLQAANFTQEERGWIEDASIDPGVRRALTLILTMEQKQEGRGAVPLFSRAGIKRTAESWGLKNKSLGLFQVRPLATDGGFYGLDSQTLHDKSLNDPAFNAKLAARRVAEIIPRAERLYRFNNEQFDLRENGCTAFVLNSYHSSEGKVLTNTFSVWTDLIDKELRGDLGDKEERRPVASSVTQRFEGIGKILLRRGELEGMSESEIRADARLILSNKSGFLKSTLRQKIASWYERKTGETLSLNISPKITDDEKIATTFINYGVRATRYGALQAIENYSLAMREQPEQPIMMARKS